MKSKPRNITDSEPLRRFCRRPSTARDAKSKPDSADEYYFSGDICNNCSALSTAMVRIRRHWSAAATFGEWTSIEFFSSRLLK